MKSIGLYFGSFNPIHLGHLIIAEYIVQNHPLDEIWFVVSPQNPFKQNQVLADENHRAKMVELATKDNDKLKLSTIEFGLPKPSYTIKTLDFLKEKFPKTAFSIIMGEDNIMNLHRWKSYEKIITNYPIYIYPRLYHSGQINRLNLDQFPKEIKGGKYTVVDAPIIELSSTAIRKAVADGQSIKYLVHNQVMEYIKKQGLYQD